MVGPDVPTPVVVSSGSSAGLKRCCQGVGDETANADNASRKIRDKEIGACAVAGVNDIIEMRIGSGGIAIASQLDGPACTASTPSDSVAAGFMAPNAAMLHGISGFYVWKRLNTRRQLTVIPP